VIAIFDIGKTNKKFFIFDEAYKIIFEESITFAEIKDEDGFPCEDIHAISDWVLATLSAALSKVEYSIQAINFSAHGASFVHLNDAGKIIASLYNYFKPFPESLKQKFDSLYNLESICLETCSPELGNLNSGKQLFWLKNERPELYHKIKYSLHLPEYFCFLLTGKCVSGITSIGCHTMLWDFQTRHYHRWVVQEGIDKKLAPIIASDQLLPIKLNGKELKCGIGLHDSSSALIPHLKSTSEPFLLLSTGTWNVSLNPFNNSPLTNDELQQDCLCFLTYQGRQVKSSRLLGGNMYEQRVKSLAEKFCVEVTHFNSLSDNASKESEISADKEYYTLVSDLIELQKQSTDLIMNSLVKKIIVEGGFAKNKLFLKLLGESYPHIPIEMASLSQASALGAAMVLQ
jgi:sugar (pentulose or hexulose) kinase